MKRLNSIVFVVFAMSLISSCATRVPFTKEIVERYDLSDAALKQVQFYTSDYIVLEASSSTGNQYVVDGKIVDSQNSKKYNIIIQPQTKCILEKKEANGDVYIRFEQGKNKILHFAVRVNDHSGRYYLVSQASDNAKRKVDYEGKEYFINSSSANSYLMVSVQKLNKSYGENKFVKGIKVK